MRIAFTIAIAALMTTVALAQGTQLERARFLLRVGYAQDALIILEALPETTAVLQGRAQAHVMIASQVSSAERCDHLRRAIDYGSMASAQNLVEFARKRFRDDGCPIAAPGS